MEGMNWIAILLGYFAVFLFGMVSLVALGLWAARRPRAARVLFAAGLLAGAVIFAGGLLSFLDPGSGRGPEDLLVIVAALSLCLAGAGQFAAAVRGRAYGAALACSAVALALTASPLFGWGWRAEALFRRLGVSLAQQGFPILVLVGLLPATTSLVLRLLPPWGPGHPHPARGWRRR